MSRHLNLDLLPLQSQSLGDSSGGTAHPSRPHFSASHFGLCICWVGCHVGAGPNIPLPQVLPISFVSWGKENDPCQAAVLCEHLGEQTFTFWLCIGWILVQWNAFEIQSMPSGRTGSLPIVVPGHSSCSTSRWLCLDHIFFFLQHLIKGCKK